MLGVEIFEMVVGEDILICELVFESVYRSHKLDGIATR